MVLGRSARRQIPGLPASGVLRKAAGSLDQKPAHNPDAQPVAAKVVRSSSSPPTSPNRRPSKPISWAKVEAISRSQAVIEFNGRVHDHQANENFLSVLIYRLDEIRPASGMFVEPGYRDSQSTGSSTRSVGTRRRIPAGQYKRIGKGGKECWIEASGNPILGQMAGLYRS